MAIRKWSIINLLYSLMIIMTVLQQYKSDFQDITRYGMYFMWAVAFAFSTFILRGKFALNRYAILFFVSVLAMFVFSNTMIGLGKYVYASLLMLKFMPIALFAYLIGVLMSQIDKSEGVLRSVLMVYVVSCTALAIAIRVSTFSNMAEWYSSEVYLYGVGKNQIGMVLTSGSIIAMIEMFPKEKQQKKKIFFAICSIIMMYVVTLVQCRTALIAFVITMVFRFILTGAINVKRVNPVYFVLICVCVLFLFTNSTIQDYFDRVFFISKYADQGASSFFSGRLSSYVAAVESINNNLVVGVGNYYVDCLYLQLLAEGGILEFLIVMPVIIGRLLFAIRNKGEHRCFSEVGLLLLIYYLATSVMEAQTPFGPGTSACIFWVISGFCDTKLCFQQENNELLLNEYKQF